ncbi:unnamed protein product [Larinioides sclopetarius]|uniref:Cysteine-rich transmembrane CYSTM domain-containing protein n=1 Tax=Larinioides sclopetarius TaxID=280406 RepID=A0AAV1ZZK1_9ARAC
MPRGQNGCNCCCERNHFCGTSAPPQVSECCRGETAPPARSPNPPVNENSNCEKSHCRHQTRQNQCCCVCVCVKCCDPKYC